jgi:hypothetical protein
VKKLGFALTFVTVLGMACPAIAQTYLPPTTPTDPGLQYNGSRSDWRSSNNNANDWRSRDDNWRNDRTQGNWRNNTWRNQAEKDDWRENNWRKEFTKDKGKNGTTDSTLDNNGHDGCSVGANATTAAGCR